MLAAIGHAKHRKMWCRVGCGWQVLSIITKIDNACSNRPQAVRQSRPAHYSALSSCTAVLAFSENSASLESAKMR